MRNHVRSMNYYGDKPYRLQPVNTANIKTDSYQRGLDRKKVNRIAANFDERIANEPKVSFEMELSMCSTVNIQLQQERN